MQVTGLIPCKAIDSYISSFVESFVPKDYQNSRNALIDSRSKKKRQVDQEGGQRGDESQSDTSRPSIDRISLLSVIPGIVKCYYVKNCRYAHIFSTALNLSMRCVLFN